MHLSVIELSRSTWETEAFDFSLALSLSFFFIRIPCERTHFNFLFPPRPKLRQPQEGKGRNLVAGYDNKLGQTSTRRLRRGRTHRQTGEVSDRDCRSLRDCITGNSSVRRILSICRPTRGISDIYNVRWLPLLYVTRGIPACVTPDVIAKSSSSR